MKKLKAQYRCLTKRQLRNITKESHPKTVRILANNINRIFSEILKQTEKGETIHRILFTEEEIALMNFELRTFRPIIVLGGQRIQFSCYTKEQLERIKKLEKRLKPSLWQRFINWLKSIFYANR